MSDRSAAARWEELDESDRPLLWSLSPMEPGDPAYHRDEVVLYWPRTREEVIS